MTPEPEIIDAALKRIEADSKHPTRKLAAKAVAEYRSRHASQLTQAQIDNNGIDNEGRRQRFVSHAVAFRRRSLFARLCWWR